LDIARCTRFDVLICRVPMTGDAAAPRLNSGFEGVAGDAAAPPGAGAEVPAPNVNPLPLVVVGVAEGGAPNELVVGIDRAGLGAPNWKPGAAAAGGAVLLPFVPPNLKGEGVAVCAPNAGAARVEV